MSGPFAQARAQLISTREAMLKTVEAIRAAQLALETAAVRFDRTYAGVNVSGRQNPRRMSTVRKYLDDALQTSQNVVDSLNDDISKLPGGN